MQRRLSVEGTPGSHRPFWLLLLSGAAILVALLVGAFLRRGPWAWGVGLVYLAYDTWLLASMVSASRSAVRSATDDSSAGAVPVDRPTLAVLVSARNEEALLPALLRSLKAQSDPPDEVLIVDDGSTDRSRSGLEACADLCWDPSGRVGTSTSDPRLRVLCKPGSGKARSLNEGLGLVTSQLVVTLDADTVLEVDALEEMRRAFARDPELVAGCGVLRPTCAGSGPVRRAFALYQRFEYLRAFLWRLAWMRQETLPLVSGAFAGFRRHALVAAGGFDPASLVEDYELLFRLHRRALERGRPPRVRVISGARATTDAPAGPAAFLRQRRRWFAGFLHTMVRNADLVANRRYGRLGTFHLVVKTLDMLLPLYALAANLAFVALVALGRGLHPLLFAILGGKFLFDLVVHGYCVAVHERWQGRSLTLGLYARGLLASATEPFLFQWVRHLGALLGWAAYLRGRTDWASRSGVGR